ncbi:MAG: class I SAM-dependent methyltransferase [Syntrophobacteraceae bacterium]
MAECNNGAEIKSQSYTYADSDRELHAWLQNFTSRIGDGSGDPEEEFLSLVKLVTNCKPNSNFLEIGCGFGRIIGIVEHSVGRAVGLEPDFKRFRACHDTFDDGDRIRIIHATSGEYKRAHPANHFDIVVVSMVLQHVSTGTCDQILRDVYDLLTPEGVAILATTQQEVERFAFQSSPGPHSEEEYNRYALEPGDRKWGLPVRAFSKASFRRVIEAAGLSVIHWGQFSYIRPEKLPWMARTLNVASEAIRDVGTSQYAVVKRGGTPSVLE